MSEIPIPVFYGLLGRVTTTVTGYSIRFYPFAFSNEPDSHCVFSVEIVDADTSAETISSLIGEEVEVTVTEESIQIDEVLSQHETKVIAKRVTANLVKYDRQDLLEHVIRLQNNWSTVNSKRVELSDRFKHLSSFVDEQIRRSNIKSDANEKQKALQAPVLRVLKRLKTELGG